MLMGGFPYVVEAVGAPASITEALRIVDNRGTVLLLGAAGVSEVDLTQVWFKEAELVGAWGHCVDGAGHSIDRALEVLAAGALPFTTVLTHEFAARRRPRGRHDRARPQGHRRHQGHACVPPQAAIAQQPPE